MAWFMETRDTREKFSNLFVKNFGDALNDEDLFRLFSPFGKIISAVVHRSSQEQSLGYGFVSFRHPQEAASAIKNLNGFAVKGRELFVDYYQTREERSIVLASHHMLEGSNLLVQNLERSIDDHQLRSCFSSFGIVTSAKVMMKNKFSLGYGFVCYSSVDAAQRALKGMNNQILCGKRLSVKVHEKKISPKIYKPTNLRVSNLDCRVNDKILRGKFSRFGNITSAKVMKNNKGVSKNYGYVCYSSHDEAESAIDHMNNMRLGDQVISVDFDNSKDDFGKTRRQNSRSKSESSIETLKKNKIFVKNLASWMTEESLVTIFSRFGTVINAEVLRANRESECCGIVTYESWREAELAKLELDNIPFGEKNLEICLLDGHDERDFSNRGAGKADDDPLVDLSSDEESDDGNNDEKGKTNLYVKNLPLDVDEDDLFEIFSAFGTIESIKVARTTQGMSKQFGYVKFTDHKAASLAVAKMHKFGLQGSSLYVTFHQTKSERTSYLQHKLLERLQGLAQQDQDKGATPQRQRAESQDRRSTRISKTERQGSDARMRSRSQAPTLRKMSHLDFPADPRPDSIYKDEKYRDADETRQQNCRNPDTEKNFQMKPSPMLKSPARHEIIVDKRKSEVHYQSQPLLITKPKSSKQSVGQQLLSQFSQKQDDMYRDETSRSKCRLDVPIYVGSNKMKSSRQANEPPDCPQPSYKPESHGLNSQPPYKPEGRGLIVHKNKRGSNSRNLPPRDHEVLNKVNPSDD